MSRIQPGIIRPVAGPAPAEIVGRGLSEGLAKTSDSLRELDERSARTRQNRLAAEWSVRSTVSLNESAQKAGEGPIENMLDEVKGQRDSLLAQAADTIDDDETLAAVENIINSQWAKTQVNTRRFQVTREAQASIATGEALLTTLTQDKAHSAEDVIAQWDDYVESQKENVYGEDAEKIFRQGARDVVREKFQDLLESSPSLAMDFVDSEIAREFLTAPQRRELTGIANGVTNSNLSQLTMQAEAIAGTDTPDRLEKIDAVIRQIEKQPESQRRTTALLKAKEDRARSVKVGSTKKANVARYMDTLRTGEGVLSGADSTTNGAYQQVKENNGSIAGHTISVMQQGGTLAPDYIKDLQAAGSDDEQDLPLLSTQLRSIGQFSRSQAARVAGTTGIVGATAFGATIRLDQDESLGRWQLLSQPGVREQLKIADDQLSEEPDTLNNAVRDITPGAARFRDIGLSLPAVRFGGDRLALQPNQSSELRDLYRFHFARLRKGGEQDPETLRDLAVDAAAQEFQNSHSPLDAVQSGNKKRLFVDNATLESNGRFSPEVAVQEIQSVAAGMLSDNGVTADLLVDDPIIDSVNTRSYLPISNLSGVTGYVEWDGGTGTARPVTSVTAPDLFAQLQQQSLSMRVNPQPNQDLARQSTAQVMSTSQGAGIVQQAIQVFRQNNGGRVPTTDADKAVVEATARSLTSGQYNWDQQ